jgi:serine/threonine protein kinase
VFDFGLAKLGSERIPSEVTANVETITGPLTQTGSILGTLYYMAPEQVEGKDTDERSDIFSFGVVLYEMITGQRPFHGRYPGCSRCGVAVVVNHSGAHSGVSTARAAAATWRCPTDS